MRIGIATSALFLLPVAAYSQPAISFPESFVWNAESRGPLMMVLPLSEKDGQLVPCGSVTAFAPKSYQTLKWEHLPEPDLFGQMGQEEKWELFQASLTERQWKLLGSAAGLGQTDLTRDQKKLFFALLPNPMTVVNASVGQEVPVSEEQRRGTRLRLTRKFHFGFINNDGSQIAAAGLPGEAPSPWQLAPKPSQNITYRVSGIPLLSETPIIGRILQAAPRQPDIVADRVAFKVDLALNAITNDDTAGIVLTNFSKLNLLSGRNSSNYGATLLEPTGTHLKPSELDLASPTLDALVSLAGANTAGELIKRVSEATKLELFCDPRFAQRRVYLRGDKARAGDVLKALCWGVSGTFRRVGSAYVLTEDLVPLALRLGKIAEWRKAAQARIEALRISNEDQLAQYQQKYLAYNDTSRPLNPAWRYGQRVPLRELSPALRGEIERQMDQWALAPSTDPNRAPLNRAFINVTPRVQLELLVPNFGTIPANWGDHPIAELPDSAPSGRLPVPVGGPPRTLAVSITSATEARQAARLGKSGGFQALWVQVGLGDKALVDAAIAAGKSEGIPVSALVRPLRATGPMEQTVEAKRSSVYLRPDLLESQATVLPQLKQLAATPGLAGLVFTDLNPTGYVDHASVEWNEILGYSQAMRLACLRQNGPDPVDLSDNSIVGFPQRWTGFNTRLTQSIVDTSFISTSGFVSDTTSGAPWFSPAPGNLWQPFIQVRTRAVDTYIEGLTKAVQQSVPALTVLRSKGDGWDMTFGPLRRFSLTSDQKVLTWNDFIGQWRGLNERKPEGLVFDGTLVSLNQITPILENIR